MDLLKGPIREGSRGGRGEFKWEDVKTDKDRENYLGHSLMAPVGRWQHGRDLTWYAKGGSGAKGSEEAQKEEARKAWMEEIRRIKEAENDALSEALGFKVTRRRTDGQVSQSEVERAIKEGGGVVDEASKPGEDEGKGVGFGRTGTRAMAWDAGQGEVLGAEQSASRSDAYISAREAKQPNGEDSREGAHRSRKGGVEAAESAERRKNRHDRSRRHRSRSRSRSPRRHRDRESRRESKREREDSSERHQARDKRSRHEKHDDDHRHREKGESYDRERGSSRDYRTKDKHDCSERPRSSRHWSRNRSRNRSRDRTRDRSRDRTRVRSRDRTRDRSRDRTRDRSKDRLRNRD